MFCTHCSNKGSEVILEDMQKTTLPVIAPRILEDEGRKCRNIGSVGCEEVGGRNGGQERIHSVEMFRNVGIAGIDGGEIAGSRDSRDSFGREVAEIKGQRVLGKFGQEFGDEKRLIDKAC